jgi:GNAT superfamily N-acetyltransferase
MPTFALLDPKRQDRAGFSCGEPTLDRYLNEQASQHHRDGIATTHVLLDDRDSTRILGFYTLSAAQLALADLDAADRKRLPRYPVPAARLARLAVASDERNKGFGALLIAHTVERCIRLRDELGIRLLVVDALNENAERFYRTYGFTPTSSDTRTFYLGLGKPR